MNYYLTQSNSQKRIIEEYLNYERLVIACDFDSTLKVWNKYEGDHCDEVCELVKDLKYIGCYLILNTANKYPEKAFEWCKSKGLEFDALNENSPEGLQYFLDNGYSEPPRKIFANVYIDDRSGLSQTYNELKTLVNLVKDGVISKNQVLL